MMKRKEILNWILCIVIAISIALLIRHFLIEIVKVEGVSMSPTLSTGERLIISKIHSKKEWKKNDIIVFEAPTEGGENNTILASYEKPNWNIFEKFLYSVLEINQKSYIKRIIAIEGDKAKIENGEVFVNGEKLEESYLEEGIKTEVSKSNLSEEFTVPEDSVFVLGDNRKNSKDSREFGCIPVSKIKGKVVFRIFPFTRLKKW